MDKSDSIWGMKMKTEKLWRPSNFPWTAKRNCIDVGKRFNGETAHVVWYTILDELGNEIMNTERANEDEDCQVRAEVAFILMTVNKSRTIIIDKKPVTIDWIGDANGYDNAPTRTTRKRWWTKPWWWYSRISRSIWRSWWTNYNAK